METLTVPVFGDTFLEGDETFFVNLANPENATIADGEGLGTIMNDDAAPPPPPPPPLRRHRHHRRHRHRRRHPHRHHRHHHHHHRRRVLSEARSTSRRLGPFDSQPPLLVWRAARGPGSTTSRCTARKQDPEHLAGSGAAEASTSAGGTTASRSGCAQAVHVARLAGVRHAEEAALRRDARPEHLQGRRQAGAQPAPARSALRSPRQAQTEHARHPEGDPERERDPLRGSRDQAATGLEERCRRVDARDRVQPAAEQGEGTYTGAKKRIKNTGSCMTGPACIVRILIATPVAQNAPIRFTISASAYSAKRSTLPPPTFIPTASATMVKTTAVTAQRPVAART